MFFSPFFFCLHSSQGSSREDENGVRTTPNLVEVAKNRPTEVISPNIPKLAMFIVYHETEEKLNGLQGSLSAPWRLRWIHVGCPGVQWEQPRGVRQSLGWGI